MLVSLKVPPTHPPTGVPPANLVGDAFGKRRSVWWRERYCRDDWLCVGRVLSILEHNYVIIDGEGKGGDEIKGCS